MKLRVCDELVRVVVQVRWKELTELFVEIRDFLKVAGKT